MDPNARLQQINMMLGDPDALTKYDLVDACRDLADWISKGGFEPEWDCYPDATRFYRIGE